MAFIETWFHEWAASPSNIYLFLDFSSLFLFFFFILDSSSLILSLWYSHIYFVVLCHIYFKGFWTCCLFICKRWQHSNFAPARGPSLRVIWNSSLHMLRSSCQSNDWQRQRAFIHEFLGFLASGPWGFFSSFFLYFSSLFFFVFSALPYWFFLFCSLIFLLGFCVIFIL